MNRIANRIDRGFNLEVRVGPPGEEPSQDEGLQKAAARIREATPNMQFLNLEGQPLLMLPEAEAKGKKKARGEEPTSE